MLEKIEVTIDSELPALPTKDQMLKQPSKEAFDAKMAECDQKIQKLRNEQKGLHTKRREVIDGGKMSGSNQTYREALTGKINELRTVNKKKRDLQDAMKVCSEQLDAIEHEKTQLRKTMHADYLTAESVGEAINRLEYK